jgi:RNA polymerase sigma-70 factor (ECF subfamily)
MTNQGGKAGDSRDLELWRGFLMRKARGLVPPMIGSQLGTSDLVQETLVDAVRNREEMPTDRSDEVRAWLYRIMTWNLREKTRKFLRTRKSDVRRVARIGHAPGAADLALVDTADSPSSEVARAEEAGRISLAVARLPEAHRRVVVWRYWEQLGYEEIGRRLGKSADAARMMHARACQKLAHELAGPRS